MHKPKRNLSRAPAQPRVFSQHLVAPAGTESIGYDVNESAQHVDYFERVGLFSSKFTQSMWLSFGAFRWILLLVIGIGAGLAESPPAPVSVSPTTPSPTSLVRLQDRDPHGEGPAAHEQPVAQGKLSAASADRLPSSMSETDAKRLELPTS
ncbi:hypothetical protein AK812_SmicGene13109 [Symbiodinium microadriaticum]|uniref:Uncharacterized protein n=1 Tax=Symbiodinium microadriaticum TaxID=2951 RepID=A0A1Q9E8Y0_SYMMI|nr:hypothetical protein AK812_SmicGene13109 [Symbiodinium microadriaticum]CAE7908793.1 unnamed protein product [Symbiodinium microadriaticum]